MDDLLRNMYIDYGDPRHQDDIFNPDPSMKVDPLTKWTWTYDGPDRIRAVMTVQMQTQGLTAGMTYGDFVSALSGVSWARHEWSQTNMWFDIIKTIKGFQHPVAKAEFFLTQVLGSS